MALRLRNKKQMHASARAVTNHAQTNATETILASSEKPCISVWFGYETVNYLSVKRSEALYNILMRFAYQ